MTILPLAGMDDQLRVGGGLTSRDLRGRRPRRLLQAPPHALHRHGLLRRAYFAARSVSSQVLKGARPNGQNCT